MRALAIALLLLAAGCVTPPGDDASLTPTASAPATPTGPAANATVAPPIGERMAATTESFVFLANRTIAIHRPDAEPLAEERVAEPASGTAFFSGQVLPLTLTPFVSFPFRAAYETTADLDITLSYVSSAPAVATTPSQSGFPAIGGWFGTPERWAIFVGATEAPASLEAGKVYTATMHVTIPPGGFFVREGEQISLTPYANYQSADGQPIQWVLGGPAPSGFLLPHSHFNLSAPRAVVLLDENGETGPNPSPTSEQNPQPADLAFTVPPDAVYIVLEVTGAAKAGPRIDYDGSIRTPGGDVLASGSGPFATEVVVLGPSALASAGRDLVAHIASGSAASGGTFHAVVTAYAP